METPYVFISYSTADQAVADKVYNSLKSENINAWIATKDIHGGESFAEEITNAINECSVFIFILSKSSDDSPHCGNELSMAFSKRKKIIPFRIEEFILSKSNVYFLQQSQWINCLDSNHLSFVELVDKVKEYLDDKSDDSFSTATYIDRTDNLIKRAKLYLEEKQFKEASKYAEEVLNVDVENSEAYLIKLLCGYSITSEDELVNIDSDFGLNVNYKWAVKFSSNPEKLLKLHDAWVDRINNSKKLKDQKRREKAQNLVKTKSIKEQLEKQRKKANIVSKMVSCGYNHVIGVKADGTVMIEGGDRYSKQYVDDWTDVVSVSAGENCSVGVRSDGRVYATGFPSEYEHAVWYWKKISSALVRDNDIIGLKDDGTVISTSKDDSKFIDWWSKICSISASKYIIAGIDKYGGVRKNSLPGSSSAFVPWQNVVSISASDDRLVGLKESGKVVVLGNKKGINLDDWDNIVSVSAGKDHVVGLNLDGTVVATGSNAFGQCDVEAWTDIVAVFAGAFYTVGVKDDGRLVSTGDDDKFRRGLYKWKLFNDIDTVEKEILDNLALKEKRKKEGLCRHCGGTFKGVFNKKCVVCDKDKDY